jgi:hypothetical protein
MVTGGWGILRHYQGLLGLAGITFIPGNAAVTSEGEFDAIVAPSSIINNNFFGGPHVTHLVHLGNGFGGGSHMFIGNELRADSALLGSTLYITGGEAGYPGETGNFDIEGGEISCQGPGQSAIQIDGDPNNMGRQGIVGIRIHSVWTQDCGGAQPAAYVTIHNASFIHMYDETVGTPAPAFISINESGPGLSNFETFDNVAIVCATPNCTEQTFILDTTAGGYTHPAPGWTDNISLYGYQAFIPHDEAGERTYAQSESYRSLTAVDATVAAATVSELNATKSMFNSPSFADASVGYNVRMTDGNEINLDFGQNYYMNSWIESYQSGMSLGKPLYINMKYGAATVFGGPLETPAGYISDASGDLYAAGGILPVYRCTGKINSGVLTINRATCAGFDVDTGLRTK